MKKIALFSLIFDVIMLGGAFAEEGSICNGNICNSYPTGTTVEQDLCYLAKKTSQEANPDSGIWESLDDNYWVKKTGQDCSARKTGAKRAVCQDNHNGGLYYTSCAAVECEENYVLWLTNTRTPAPQSQGVCFTRASRQAHCDKGCRNCKADEKCMLKEIDFHVPGFGVTRAFIGEEECGCQKVSCEQLYPNTNSEDYKKCKCEKYYPNNDEAQACCKLGKQWNEEKQTCECGEDQVWNKEEKKCVAEKKEKECEYKFSGTVDCGNGKTYTIEGTKQVTVKCPEAEDADIGGEDPSIEKLEKMFKKDKDSLVKLRKELCGEKEPVTPVATTSAGPDKEKVDAAISTLKKFTESAGKEASVWRDAEGNFNKARLASDLTAGVVLGTVGGVVSGVVIKKKQVEKGFEALHCTVGGQKIAGWGDEFSVGLQK